MNSRHRLFKPLATASVAIAVVILVSACGGAKKPPPAAGSGTTTQGSGKTAQGSPGAAAYRYSACMRTHGVTNFQDPHVSRSGNQVKVAIHVDPQITGSPAFKSADQACAHILPGGGNGPTQAQMHAREEAMLGFARCMRRHGFPRFPDPTAQGQLTLAMITRAGIDLQQPAVKPAAYACIPFTHGLMTKADINQAIANPNGGSQSSSGGGG